MKASKALLDNRVFINSKLGANKGIYFLIDDSDEVVYVGQCINGESRVGDHLKEKRKVFSSYYFLCLGDISQKELDNEETKYIIKYAPKYNGSFGKGNRLGYINFDNYGKLNNINAKVLKFISGMYGLHYRCVSNHFIVLKKDLDNLFKSVISERDKNPSLISEFSPFYKKDNTIAKKYIDKKEYR